MKTKHIFLIAGLLVIAALVVSCAGPDGTVGPQGPTGPEGPAGQDGGGSVGAEYVGAEVCGVCHAETYETFMMSGHPYKLNQVVDGQAPEYPFTELTELPEGYTWDDISYVIGGYNWKARFIDLEGYIITGDEDATTQYNFYNENLDMGDNWVGYHAGDEEVPYNCGTCHTTGYNPEGHQDDLPGLIGTWSEGGIMCEECHGPGSNHAADPYGVALLVDRDAEACGACHRRGDVEQIDASGGFIKHHEQYEELFQSQHVVIDCVICHDPHTGVVQLREAGVQTTRTTCENCHYQEIENQAVDTHLAINVECIDCHMPLIARSALGNPDTFEGDIRVHIMAINPNQIGQFTEDGSQSLSQISLDFACRHCHVNGGVLAKTDVELIEAATGYHTP